MRRRTALGLGIFVGLVCAARPSSANPGINGYTGMPLPSGGNDSCDTNCHKPSTPIPTLDITIPATVQAGSTNTVKIVVNGTRVRTSLDAAFDRPGVKITKGQNTEVPFPDDTPEEVVAVTPPPTGASGTYQFSFIAPSTNGTMKLWIAAMSASGAGTANDGVAKTTRTITITGGSTAPSDAGTGPVDPGTSDDGGAGSSSGGEGGGEDDGGATSSSGGSNGGTDATSPRRLPAGDDGCSVSAVPRPDHGPASALAIAALVAAALVTRRKTLP
jgi:hypothetical protein